MFKGKSGRSTRILFVTDLHASEITFRKVLNAVAVYEATVLVIGGDLAGKRIVPILRGKDDYSLNLSGESVIVDEAGLLDVMRKARNLGQYPFLVSQEEYESLSDDASAIESRFVYEMHTQIEDWMQRVAAKFEPLAVPVYVTGGNDDYLSIEEIIDQSAWITNAEGRVIEIAEGIEMISTGFGNPTPWNCPRDISEEELFERIDQMAARLSSPERAVFNLHVPPYGSGLDLAPLLDTSVDPPRPIVGEQDAVGSRAVRQAIEKYRPALSLHGHIHESRGIQKIGPTTCVNPGSEYTEGLLRSAVADFDNSGRLNSVQLLVA